MKTAGRRRAFTLLELLVAMTITLLIAGLMLTITTQLLAVWQRHQGEHLQAVAATQALDLLERDLQAAVSRDEARPWLAAEIIDTPAGLANHGWLVTAPQMKPAQGDSLRPLPPADATGHHALEEARFGLSGVWLRFVTTNIESGGSLPVIVAYQLARRPITGDAVSANPAPVRYALYRSAISPAETFTAGYDVTASVYASPNNTPSGALGGSYRTPRNVMNPSHANLLASNVVDFGCWLYARHPDGTLLRLYPDGPADTSHIALGSGATEATRYPDVADVFIRVLSDAGAAQIEALESGRLSGRPAQYADDAAWWWGVVEANSAVFTRRIEIKGGAG